MARPSTTLWVSRSPYFKQSHECHADNFPGWQRQGQSGPLLLQDFHLIDLLSHFDRKFYLKTTG